jgi:hypothetical protein
MARQRRSRDWQERAFEESEIQRKERAAEKQGGPPNPVKSAADPPRRSTWKWTVGGVAAIIVAIIVRSGLDSRAPSLTTSCTTPAFALSSSNTHRGSIVRWSATGPAGSHFLIAIGVARLEPDATVGQLHAVPDPGHSAGTTEEAVPATALSAKCTGNGAFSVSVPAGRYNVRMFSLQSEGTTGSGTVAATKQLVVSS